MSLTTNLNHKNHSSSGGVTADYFSRSMRSPSPQTLATCYTVDAASMQLQSFNYSTLGAGGTGWWGTPSPPLSPPLAASVSSRGTSDAQAERRRRGAAQTVAGECERLFCGTLSSVFLGEGGRSVRRPLAAGVHIRPSAGDPRGVKDALAGCSTTPNGSPDALDGGIATGFGQAEDSLVEQWIEVFDYGGGAHFRGFIAGDGVGPRTLFIFFDDGVVGNDLKPGLMALLELCETPSIDCSKLVASLDRHAAPEDLTALSRDLGWVGFEPYTLVDWTRGDAILSDTWLFLSMDV